MKIACLNCGANVVFDPDNNNLYCDTCKTSMPMYELDIDDIKYDRYLCNSCGAELLVDENSIITDCSYCGSKELFRKYLNEDYKPEVIIPFTFSPKKVKSIFEEYLKNNHVSAKKIGKNYCVSEVRGVYVPCVFWEYQIEAYNYHDKTSKNKTLSKNKVLKIFSFCDFSKKIPNKIIKEIGPYPLEDFISKNYNPIYTMGFAIERGDEYSKKNIEKIKKIEENLEKGYINTIIGKEKNIDNVKSKIKNIMGARVVNIKKVKRVNVLVPIYFLHMINDNSRESFAINGFDEKVIGKLNTQLGKLIKSIFSREVLALFFIMITVMIVFTLTSSEKILMLKTSVGSLLYILLYLILLVILPNIVLSFFSTLREKKKEMKSWIYLTNNNDKIKFEEKSMNFFDEFDKPIYINGIRTNHQIRKEEYLRKK